MESIQEVSRRIERSLADKYKELQLKLQEINSDIDRYAAEFRKAAQEGDVSENAAYTQAKEKLESRQTDKYRTLASLDDVKSAMEFKKYVPRDYIAEYSTFRLQRMDTGEISEWRAYPGNMFALELGILSTSSDIFLLLKDKKKDDIVSVVHRITGVVVDFKILDVY